MEHIVKQRINTPHRIPPCVFDEKHIDDYSSIYIVSNNRLYGVTDDDDEFIVPMEYDNITVIGFGLLQLVQNGKLGLAHLVRASGKDNQPFSLETLLPCEFDSIVCPWYEEIVILRKDEAIGMKVKAYFTEISQTTEWYEDYEILDRDILELRDPTGSYLYDARNGKVFLHHENKSLFSFDAPFKKETDLNFSEIGSRGIVITTFGEKDSLIYYNGKRTRQYYYEGEVHPIYTGTDCHEGHRPVVNGFIIEADGGMVLLSADCQRLRTDKLASIQVHTRIEAYSKDTNQTVVYPFASDTYHCKQDIKDFFANCDELFGSELDED